MPKQLREYHAKFFLVRPGEKPINREASGRRSKLGGSPDWLQHDERPLCGDCGQPMTFVAQIDSLDADRTNVPFSENLPSRSEDYMFGDLGMLYVFVCFDCLRSANVIQCG